MSSTKGQSPKPATPDAPTKPKVAAIAAATKSASSSSPASPASPASATNKQLNGKKQPAVVTESPLSSTPTNKSASKQPVKESTPEPERNPDEKLNPYAEVIAKRLRALKKRLTKIEKNEELQAQGQKLDQDQLKSVSQKAEVMYLITELEEISKVFQDVTIEEEKLEKAEKKRLAVEEQKKIAALKEQQQQEFKKLLEPLYVLSTFTDADVRTLLTTQGIEGFLLSQEELQILDTVTSTLYGKYQTSIGLTEASKRFFNRVKKLSAKGTENVAPGLTYTTAQALLQKISVSPFFDPELATKLATERANREAAEEAARKEQEEMHNSYEIIRPEEIPPFAPMSPEQMNGLPGGAPLAFLGESEVLGVQPVLSFDGSPAVVVPIPQTLFYAQIATPLYPSFRPTTSQPIISHHHQPVPSQQQPIAAAVPIPAAHEAAQPQQPTPSQDASIAAAPQIPPSSSSSSFSSSPSPSSPSPSSSQPSQQRFNQNGRGRGNGAYRGNGSPQERRYSDRSPSSDRPPQQPRSERGASSAAHRGARGGFRGAKSPQAQTA